MSSDWKDLEARLDRWFPRWRVEPPPGSEQIHAEGEQALTNASPVANAKPELINLKAGNNEVIVIHAVELLGDQLEIDAVEGRSVYRPMAPTAIRNKLHWSVKADSGTLLRNKTYTSGIAGIQRLKSLNAATGFKAIVLHPGRTLTLLLTMIDPAAAPSLPAGNAVLNAAVLGYAINLSALPPEKDT